jgi:hypothetical protein
MRFTAQGYAILNHRLNPDLCVLEGGYSIESALPYINTGIILAMAGMDYSNIREPDYDPRKQIQPKHITEFLQTLKEYTMHHWHNRKELRYQVYPDQPFHKRSVHIFYDTARIRENLNEVVRQCYDCGGALTLDSSADTGRHGHIFAVQLPRYCCDPCRKWGEKQFELANPSDYAQIFLQDKDRDEYHIK